jgi:hypothetical protein
MMTMASRPGDRDLGGYVVRRPRVTDAIGAALLRTFGHGSSVPDEMHRLLDRIDRLPQRRG